MGQITPVLVIPCDEAGFDAELVDGERRLQACRQGRIPIDCVLNRKGKLSPADRFALSVAANFCRQDHDVMEIAEAIAHLESQGRSGIEIAGIFGKTASWISQNRSLLRLHPEVQAMLKRPDHRQRVSRVKRRARGSMTRSLALLLVPLDGVRQLRAAKHILRHKLSMGVARNYIQALAAGCKVKVGKQISPRARLMQLWNSNETFHASLGRFTAMPYAQLAAVAGEANARERAALLALMDQTTSDLVAIAKTFRKADAS